MKNDKLHKMDFGGKTVWITIWQPSEINPETGKSTEEGFITAFKIGDEPRMYDGEYIKENGKLKFFPDSNAAYCAATEAARKRIHEGI